jgi:hypothetical protein
MWLGVGAVAVGLLWAQDLGVQWGQLLGFLVILLCPLLHFLGFRGHGSHGGAGHAGAHGQAEADAPPARGARETLPSDLEERGPRA